MSVITKCIGDITTEEKKVLCEKYLKEDCRFCPLKMWPSGCALDFIKKAERIKSTKVTI